jgi:AI-2 transport protein TqsA
VKDTPLSPFLRFLLVAACTVIVLAGIRAASDVVGPILLSLLLAYALAPLPKWLIHHVELTKAAAIAITAATIVAVVLFLVFPLGVAANKLAGKLPVYQERMAILSGQITTLANAHGFVAPILSFKTFLTPERLQEIARVLVPEAGLIVSNGLLISLLVFLFVAEMTEGKGAKSSALAQNLADYGADARSYVSITAKTGAINALLNLGILLVCRVDTPGLWCFLYFFLNFTPTLGFLIALVPPTLIALLMFGWHRALLVAIGLVLTNTIVDNVVRPIFMKRAIEVSFLEVTVSLVFWTFLLGLSGAVLAVPLTLALKRFLAKTRSLDRLAAEVGGV